jgi:hypothetical protein
LHCTDIFSNAGYEILVYEKHYNKDILSLPDGIYFTLLCNQLDNVLRSYPEHTSASIEYQAMHEHILTAGWQLRRWRRHLCHDLQDKNQ